jgi:hypothetical protein
MLTNNSLNSAKKELSKLSDELKADVRLRAGAWFIALIVALQPIWLLQDYRTTKEAELEDLLIQEAKILRTTSEDFWQERAARSNEDLSDLTNSIPLASSLGVAKATLQNLLSNNLEQINAQNVRLDVQDPTRLTKPSDTYRVSARIEFDFNEADLQTLLSIFEKNTQAIVVEKLEVNPSRSKRVQLMLAVYFKLDTPRAHDAANAIN